MRSIEKIVAQWRKINEEPMSYRIFKLSLELSAHDTFEKEDYCNRLYEVYLNGRHNKFSKHK